MKNFILIFFLLIQSTLLRAQENYYKCDYKMMHNSFAITPSLKNLLGLLNLPYNSFVYTMKEYSYSLGTDSKEYIANNDAGSPLYSISKTGNSITMIYTTDDGGFADTLKTQLRSKGIQFTFDSDGYEIYKTKYTDNGITYHYTFYLKEDSEGGCVVGLKLN